MIFRHVRRVETPGPGVSGRFKTPYLGRVLTSYIAGCLRLLHQGMPLAAVLKSLCLQRQ